MPDNKDNMSKGNKDKGGAAAGGGAVDVQKYLGGVDYPATRQDLMDAASDNDAPQHVMDALSSLPEKEYGSVADVSKEVANKK